MVSYSKEAGTTFRKWDNDSFQKNDATVEITVSPDMGSDETRKLFSVMSRLHENFFGNPLAIRSTEINMKREGS